MIKSAIILTFFCLAMNAGTVLSQELTRFQSMDRNGDGRISRAEFRGSWRRFSRLDRNIDGYITLAEAKRTPLLGSVRRQPSARGEGGQSQDKSRSTEENVAVANSR